MNTPKFVLVEESGTGFDVGPDALFDDKSEALNAREAANREAFQYGIPVHFRLFRLTEVPS